MTTIPLPALAPALIAVFVGWRVYRRVRRLVGRQPVRTRRLVVTTIVFPPLLIALALTALQRPEGLAALAAGVAIGTLLARWGLHRTRFESVGGVRSYVPDAKIGIAVALLFVGRIAYHVGAMLLAGDRGQPLASAAFGSNPLTLASFGVVAAYFTVYAVGILRWSRDAGHPLGAPRPSTNSNDA